jgi:hypothetical protein
MMCDVRNCGSHIYFASSPLHNVNCFGTISRSNTEAASEDLECVLGMRAQSSQWRGRLSENRRITDIKVEASAYKPD